MYSSFFGLREKPFSITPDPRFLYMSERHAEALAHLQYGVMESGGFIQLTGEVGTGKTTVTRSLLNRLPESVEIAAILNPRVTVREFLTTICEEFHLGLPEDAGSTKALVDQLNEHLLECHAAGRRAVLIVDEAQNLEREVLEQLRLLTNLETETHKLLQIILIGQPELRQTLARSDLRQLAQRITGRYHLETLSLAETSAYVRHRLAVAGATYDIFTTSALWEVHRLSGGVPRLINVICDRALLGAYTAEKHRVSRGLLARAAAEISGRRVVPASLPRVAAGVGLAIAVAAVGATVWRLSSEPAGEEARPEAAAALPAAVDAARVPAERRLEPGGSLKMAIALAPPATSRSTGPLSVDALLRESGALTGTDAAFVTLFGLWGAQFRADGGQPCRQAERQGLKCEYQLGSWTLLRAMDRPAILSLVDADGDLHHAVVTALGDEALSLEIGGRSHTVPLAELAPHWFGEYLVLWKPHQGADGLMLPGSRGEQVAWLRATLDALLGTRSVVPEPAYYDPALEEQVRRFQRRAGIKADGKAGIQTLMSINAALDTPGTPYLHGGG